MRGIDEGVFCGEAGEVVLPYFTTEVTAVHGGRHRVFITAEWAEGCAEEAEGFGRASPGQSGSGVGAFFTTAVTGGHGGGTEFL